MVVAGRKNDYYEGIHEAIGKGYQSDFDKEGLVLDLSRLEQLTKELEIVRKKREALKCLYTSERISQPPYEQLESELANANYQVTLLMAYSRRGQFFSFTFT